MTGLDGTPMPSFSDNIKPDEAWDLVFYLRTLQPLNTLQQQREADCQAIGIEAGESKCVRPSSRSTLGAQREEPMMKNQYGLKFAAILPATSIGLLRGHVILSQNSQCCRRRLHHRDGEVEWHGTSHEGH